MKLNKRFSKNIHIAKDRDGIVIKGHVTILLLHYIGMVIQKLEIRRQN